MKYALLLAVFVALLSTACSEQSIDNAVEDNGVAGSMTEGEQSAEEEALANGRVEVKPRWQPVMELKGSGDKRSKNFSVDGAQWRISWSTEPIDDNKEFFIFLYDKEGGEDPIIIATSPENDMAELDGSGLFYIEVRASQPYNIEVKEYK